MPLLFLSIVFWAFLIALIFAATFGARVLLKRFEMPSCFAIFAAPTLYLIWIAGFLLLDTDRFAVLRTWFFLKMVLSNLLWLLVGGIVSTLILRYFKK